MQNDDLNDEEIETLNKLNKIIDEHMDEELVGFKRVERKILKQWVQKINRILPKIRTDNLTSTNNLIKACSILVGKEAGLKVFKKQQARVTPWWKRRIQSSIKEIRSHISILDRKRRKELIKSRKYMELEKKYHVKRKGLGTVIEELRQRLQVKSTKIKRYDQRIEQFRLDEMFQVDQKKVYQQLNGETKSSEKPDANESKEFWSNIWDREVKHNTQAEWLQELKEESVGGEKQDDLVMTTDMVTKQSKKMPNWKSPGPDGVQGYWIKNLTALHERIAVQMNDLLVNGKEVPKWLTTGRTILCQKDPSKGGAVDNYRPISCLPLMWKLMTGIISNSVYDYLEINNILPSKQKGCKRKSRGTKDQLLIDKTVMKDCKKRHTNLGMAWIDYRKAYDMIPHSWILESLEMVNVADNVIEMLKRSMNNWNVNLTSSGDFLGNVNIKRGIFQGDSLSPLLFVVCMIPLSRILRKVKVRYTLKNGEKLNHVLFMDDLKLFGKNENQVNSLVSTVQVFSDDIKMEFGVKKCGILIMHRGAVAKTKTTGIVLPSGETIKHIDEDGYKYLGILEFDSVKEKEMKEAFATEYFRRVKLVCKSKLNGKNKVNALNTWAISLMRYGAGILNWRVNEVDQMDRKTRKIFMINKEFHPKSDIDRLYVPRKKEVED